MYTLNGAPMVWKDSFRTNVASTLYNDKVFGNISDHKSLVYNSVGH